MESLLPENQEFWRIDAIPLQFFLEHRHSYPSRDEQVVNESNVVYCSMYC